MNITPAYADLNRQLHASNDNYGRSGYQFAPPVIALCQSLRTQDVLDYGCGKRTLEMSMPFPIFNYDPCVEGFDEPPTTHDIVVCTDVLEHIEPDTLADVLADIRRCTRVVAFITIATGPAKKVLADGRNAHLIQAGQEWWLEQLWRAGFTVRELRDNGKRIELIAA